MKHTSNALRVLLAPGEGLRYEVDEHGLILTYKGYAVRVGEPINPNGGHTVNVSGKDIVVYLDPPAPE